MNVLTALCLATAFTALAVDANNSTNDEPSEANLLLAQETGVLSIDLVHRTHKPLNNLSAVGVDFHFKKGLLFFTQNEDITDSKLFAQALNSSESKLVVKGDGLWLPAAVAVDWVGDKLYVVDEVGRKVDVFELDGSRQAVLLSANLSSPADVALDPIAGLLFIGDIDQVVRANMDGSQSKTIIAESTGTNYAFSVAVDPGLRRLYFASAILEYIDSSDYDGNSRSAILKGQASLINPWRIALADDRVFWSDDLGNRVRYTDKRNSSIGEILGRADFEALAAPRALRVLHPARQPASENPCGTDNGGCSHFCLLSNADGRLTRRCACQRRFALNRDLRTCHAIEEFLVYSRKSVLEAKALRPAIDGYNDVFALDFTIDRFVGVDFDSSDGYLYYTEINDNRIYKIHRNGTGKDIVLNASSTFTGELQAEGLAVDWMAKNLYYVQSQRGSLHVMSMRNGAHKKTLLRGLSRPRSIALHPKTGLMFFSEVGEPAAISRGDAAGGRLSKFGNVTLGWPNGLAVDHERDRLYWCDGLLHRVQHADLEGRDVKTVASELIQHPFSIAVHAQFAYVTDWKTFGLIRFDKVTGEGARVLLPEFPGKRMLGVKVYSEKAQPSVEGHPCAGRHGCQKFCFATSRSGSAKLRAKCACGDGEAVAPDGRSCVPAAALRLCPSAAFACANRRCVPQAWACDGVDDCGDNTDEEHCGL